MSINYRIIVTIYVFRWFVPIIGHMGICTSGGVIRDFAGPYYVSVSILFLSEYISTHMKCLIHRGFIHNNGISTVHADMVVYLDLDNT